MRRRVSWRLGILIMVTIGICLTARPQGQIPLDRVLKRVTVPSTATLRGLVDTVGFPHTAEQMTFVGDLCEKLERDELEENAKRLALPPGEGLIAAWCPHDDYALAARVYVHVVRNVKAKTVILVGNAHWSEAFGVRSRLIFGDFRQWRGPYSPVRVSPVRDDILKGLDKQSYLVNRQIVETEHSLEAIVPYLQYYDRDVEIVPILVPLMSWQDMERIGGELADSVARVVRSHGWKLGRDVAIVCSGDGQHYGDYGWSYYDFHPYGCDPDGYKQSMALDQRLVSSYLAGRLEPARLKGLFEELVDQQDIGKYRITWCGRFAVPFGLNFAAQLTQKLDGRTLTGYLLRSSSSLALPWLPLGDLKMGLTGDANLHHFVTYVAIGYR
jgi:AmmeMemoRadiSam system protein B